jgi:hypothetical protein
MRIYRSKSLTVPAVINTETLQDLRDIVAVVDDEPLAAMEPVDLIETAEPPTGIDDGEDADGLDDASDVAESVRA